MSVCCMGCGCYRWGQKENVRLDTTAKALPWSLSSEEMYKPSAIPPAVSQRQYVRARADAHSLSGYISVELPFNIDMSFEALQPPCINISGVRSAPNRAVPEPSQESSPSCLAILLLQILHSLSSDTAVCVPCTTNNQLEHTDRVVCLKKTDFA